MFSRLIILLMLAYGWGCAPVLQKPPVPPSTPSQWPAFAAANFSKIESFEGKAKLTVESPQASGTMQIKVVWIRPDTLFLAAEGPLGINLGKVFIGRRRFIIYNEYQNQYISGNLDNPYLTQFLQTSFSLTELKSILLGMPPSGWDSLQPVAAQPGLFIKFSNGVKYRYHVNLRTGLLEKWEMVTGKGTEMVMTLERYRVIEGVWFPRLIRLTRSGQMELISVFYQSIRINQPIPVSAYRIVIKPGVQQLNVQ